MLEVFSVYLLQTWPLGSHQPEFESYATVGILSQFPDHSKSTLSFCKRENGVSTLQGCSAALSILHRFEWNNVIIVSGAQ